MNSLERTLIEKAGYDNGWEVVVESIPERVVMASALHRANALVKPVADAGKWSLTLPAGALSDELSKGESNHSNCDGHFLTSNETELGRLLRHAARLARSLPDLPEIRFAMAVQKELHAAITSTEVERLVRQRVGQDIYRESLMDYWGGACAVTGIKIPALLRASHAKPWAECASDGERLNVFNGFLLAAHLDALFDRNLITFDEHGELLFSPDITSELQSRLGLTGALRLRWISPNHSPFLEWHRMAFRAHF